MEKLGDGGGCASAAASRIPTRSEKTQFATKGSSKVHKPLGQNMNSTKLAKTVGPKELKENMPRNRQTAQHLSSTGSMLVAGQSQVKRMGFMEMKRVNQDLVLEMQAIREAAEVRESNHQDTIDKLTQEILTTKEIHARLQEEIEHYQKCLATKNSELDALQRSLEEIKFENQQLATILEGARLDATGARIKLSEEFSNSTHRQEMDLDCQHKELDHFITSLQSTLSLLQEQESKLQSSPTPQQ